jgi:hypothetical protein
MMKTRHVFAAIVAGTFAVGASAQNLKPGLWEVTQNVKGGAGDMSGGMSQMHQQMASMPPHERKMMEDMMAQRGMKMGSGGMSTRTCMTKEMLERNELPTQKDDCKTTKQQRSGNTMKFSVSCSNPPSSGEGQVTYVSPEAYTMKMNVNTTVSGKPETMSMDTSGKWLGSDCGSIKPMGAPARK